MTRTAPLCRRQLRQHLEHVEPVALWPPTTHLFISPLPIMRQFIREFFNDFHRHPVVSTLGVFVPTNFAGWVRESPTVALPVTLAVLLVSFVLVSALPACFQLNEAEILMLSFHLQVTRVLGLVRFSSPGTSG